MSRLILSRLLENGVGATAKDRGVFRACPEGGTTTHPAPGRRPGQAVKLIGNARKLGLMAAITEETGVIDFMARWRPGYALKHRHVPRTAAGRAPKPT